MDDQRSEDLIPALTADEVQISKPKFSYDLLLPQTETSLTPSEAEQLGAFKASLVILGPAGGAVLTCPGNQENLTDDRKCPYFAKCPLLKAKKAPANALCPIERTLIEERFSAWCREIGQEPDELSEVNRMAVSELTWLDLQETRCQNILSSGEAARLTQVNVTEAVNYTTTGADGEQVQTVLPLTWERVLHVNTERLDNIMDRRRMLLRDMMLTPEMKWKVARAEGRTKGTDLGSQQAVLGDKLRKLDPVYE